MQVSTVLSAFQAESVSNVSMVVESVNCAVVALVSMGSLNVKTTGAVGGTFVAPSAGSVERIAGWARIAGWELSARPASNRNDSIRMAKDWWFFISFLSIIQG